ncbi:hypothetical protein D3C76_1768160 [compost metagenome]
MELIVHDQGIRSCLLLITPVKAKDKTWPHVHARSLGVEIAQCSKGWEGWLFLRQFTKLEITQEAAGDLG